MNHRTKYPPGSPRDILVRLLRLERECRQILTDVKSCNDHNPHFASEPMDVGTYLVRLKKLSEVIAAVREVIAAGEPKLPEDILAPILEEW